MLPKNYCTLLIVCTCVNEHIIDLYYDTTITDLLTRGYFMLGLPAWLHAEWSWNDNTVAAKQQIVNTGVLLDL